MSNIIVKFYNCETERDDIIEISNIDTDNVDFEMVKFDVKYGGEIANNFAEYVNTSKYGKKFVEKTDSLLCIGSDGEFRLMELIGLSRKDYVPTHEIWDALDSWLSGKE